MTIIENILNGISEGLVNSFAGFVTSLILGILNPILTGIGFPAIEL